MRRASKSLSPTSPSDTTMRSRENSYSEPLSQWELLMRKFSEDCKLSVDCKRVPELVKPTQVSKSFGTGSNYEGPWNLLGMTGQGTYTFPNGVVYKGEFFEGMFHGEGEMRYPSGLVVRGRWKKGVIEIQSRSLNFEDGLHYDDTDWTFCKKGDRRYSQERKKSYDQFEGLKPGFESYMTADQPSREIPKGFYDTGTDFYKEGDAVGFKYDDVHQISRPFSKHLAKWAVKNCRKSGDDMVGPCKEVYDQWWDCRLPCDLQSTPSSSRRVSAAGSLYEDPNERMSCAWGRPSFAVTGGGWNRKNIKFDPEMDD